eukprot:comp19251_c0_seq1/m.22038 comp19251_c0_seq1/g.22038  ORF comp19251_c0_seq1/g.22038 comp19251_c0_seq1/m.22038 type:complete len:182 (-) comp19251_c0_seq1:341-886(-)
MCRFMAALFSAVLFVFSTFAAIYGLVSLQWFTGNGFNIGIPSGCNSTTTADFAGSSYALCTSFSWSSLNGGAEKAMASMQLIAAFFGATCLLLLLVTLLCCCCCLGLSGPMISFLGGLQGSLLAATCFTMAAHYDWSAPAGTNIGPAYVINIVGIFAAWLAAFLAGVHHRTSETVKNVTYA